METNANRFRIVLMLWLLLLACTGQKVLSQEKQNHNQRSVYTQYNFNIFLHSSNIYTEPDKTLVYDYGIGGIVELEAFFSQKFSTIVGTGLNIMNASTKTKDYKYRILAVPLRIASKYYITDRTALLGGFTGFYAALQQQKTKYIDETWGATSLTNDFQIGFLAGADFYLEDWASLRPRFVLRTQSISYELGFVVFPGYLF